MNIDNIRDTFPKIELSYERVHHKKVPNMYLAIPSGKKNFLWFTHHNGEDICYLIDTNKYFEVVKYKRVHAYFDKQLCYGTVLYGTIVSVKKSQFFTCENVFYYCGKNICRVPFKIALDRMCHMFDNLINCIAYTTTELIITTCMMTSDKNEMLKKINDENYNIYGILCRNLNNSHSYILAQNNRNDNHKKVLNFKVMADLKYNVYKLYYYDNKDGLKLYQKTYIPDYKTTVMLNNKFRIIKENSNLDLLEESDDEDEFENTDEDKFVYLDRQYTFRCYFHYKSKRWIPYELSNDKRIVSSDDLKRAEYK